MPILHWLTREQDLHASGRAPFRLLEHVETYGEADSQNMLIQGDNLDALKALLPYYAGKVKCVYIDPPFNTGQAFEHYDDNLEHSTWLSMIYPRLELLRELLSEDGFIFIHIDDEELFYLTTVCDEIFGRSNKETLVTFKQGAATGHKSINRGMVKVNNFILIYSKNKNKSHFNKVFIQKERDKRYTKYIENIEDNFKCWKFTTLQSAFSNKFGKKTAQIKKEIGAELYEVELLRFVIEHSERVVRLARPDYDKVSYEARALIDMSEDNKKDIFLLKRDDYPDMYITAGERILFYADKLKLVDGELVSGEPLNSIWDDVLSNNLHNEGHVSFPKSKKPEALIKRVFELTTKTNDLVLDSFLGSGTTAAVAHKMGRRYIGVEIGDHAVTHCIPRLQKVIGGEQGGISKAVNWQGGGGFRFYRLGEPIFAEDGSIRKDISFAQLAAHVWFAETGIPMQADPTSPLLGIHEGTACYLLYNGILGDKKANGGNVLTNKILQALPPHEGPKVIYGERSLFTAERLKSQDIVFKQTPYDIKGR